MKLLFPEPVTPITAMRQMFPSSLPEVNLFILNLISESNKGGNGVVCVVDVELGGEIFNFVVSLCLQFGSQCCTTRGRLSKKTGGAVQCHGEEPFLLSRRLTDVHRD
jgi:hypothetical protein